MATELDIRKNAVVELQVEKLAFGGRALARVNNLVVFIDNAIPGQLVRVLITRKKRQYVEGRAIEVISQPDSYTVPFCPHFGVCGGCMWQNLSYKEQLRWKRIHVVESLQHVAGIDDVMVEPVVPSPQTVYYRNKMEYTFADRRWLLPEEIAEKYVTYGRSFTLGLHVRGAFDKVFDLQTCFLESTGSVDIVRTVRDWCRESGIAPYTTKSHQGFWRFLVVREGKRTEQTLIHLITAAHPRGNEVVDALARRLIELFPHITTFVHSVSQKKAQVAIGDTSRVVFGPGFIEEILGDRRFRISAHSFFQTNSYGAEKLYETVHRFGQFSGDETVWDLYCGTGSIALFIASYVKQVIGYEVVEDAIQDAYTNCELNNVDNCRFFAGDLKEIIGTAQQMGKPDVVITDPPRAGMHPKVVQAILEAAPSRIIAVSCNPSTLARDLTMLLERYTIGKIQPFDLFPHTPHIECIVQLKRKNRP